MILSEVILSIEFAAAVFTLIYIGKLLFQAADRVPDNRELRSHHALGSCQMVKRSLLNQHVHSRAALATHS